MCSSAPCPLNGVGQQGPPPNGGASGVREREARGRSFSHVLSGVECHYHSHSHSHSHPAPLSANNDGLKASHGKHTKAHNRHPTTDTQHQIGLITFPEAKEVFFLLKLKGFVHCFNYGQCVYMSLVQISILSSKVAHC